MYVCMYGYGDAKLISVWMDVCMYIYIYIYIYMYGYASSMRVGSTSYTYIHTIHTYHTYIPYTHAYTQQE